MTKKYKLTKETKEYFGTTLYQIEALMDFGDVSKGDKGGFIEKEENLSQEGDAWVSGNARVFGDAEVFGNARVSGDAEVFGNARVFGDAWVSGNARVFGNARVSGDAEVFGNARVFGDAEVYGNAEVSGDAEVYKKIKLTGGYFYHTKQKSETIEKVETCDSSDYETLCNNPKIEEESPENNLVGKEVEVKLDGKTYKAKIIE